MTHIREGDILVSLAPEYNPDPTGRKFNDPAGTHVSLVDKELEKGCLRLIDWSRRKWGRGYDPEGTHPLPPLKKADVAYSWLSLTKFLQVRDAVEYWNCHFWGQKKERSRGIVALYLRSEED